MSALATLPATKRDLSTKARQIRKQNLIPAEYYGAKEENLHLALDYQTFRKVFKEAGGSTLVNLTVEGESKPREILIHSVTYNPITDTFQHVDLVQIQRGKKMVTRVPLHFTGESPAVKNFGGILTHHRNEIEIRCLPKDLIKEVLVDVSVLEQIGSALRVTDLPIDRNIIEVLEHDDVSVVSIAAPKTTEQIDADLNKEVEVVSADVKAEGEAEKAQAQAHKENDSEKKGREK